MTTGRLIRAPSSKGGKARILILAPRVVVPQWLTFHLRFGKGMNACGPSFQVRVPSLILGSTICCKVICQPIIMGVIIALTKRCWHFALQAHSVADRSKHAYQKSAAKYIKGAEKVPLSHHAL